MVSVEFFVLRILIYTNATICEGLEVELQDVKLQGVVSEVAGQTIRANVGKKKS